jgi:hypothetical protein
MVRSTQMKAVAVSAAIFLALAVLLATFLPSMVHAWNGPPGQHPAHQIHNGNGPGPKFGPWHPGDK